MLRWRYMTGFPTERAPAAVGDKLFVTSDEPMLHCIDAKTGLPQWQVPGILQFAAVTKEHVYGVDRFGTIHILNISDGSRVGRIANEGALRALVNDQTDRLYLISDSGLVQCLHEVGADKPTRYIAPAAAEKATEGEEAAGANEEYRGDGEPAAAAESAEPAVAPKETAEPAANENPFGAGAEEEAPAADNSGFGTGDENPFE